MPKCTDFINVPETHDYYTIYMRENYFIYVTYGTKGMYWWHDISRNLIGK